MKVEIKVKWSWTFLVVRHATDLSEMQEILWASESASDGKDVKLLKLPNVYKKYVLYKTMLAIENSY